jgi:hypothetical protein
MFCAPVSLSTPLLDTIFCGVKVFSRCQPLNVLHVKNTIFHIVQESFQKISCFVLWVSQKHRFFSESKETDSLLENRGMLWL